MPDAILFCVDNSEWVRNGDYSPRRIDAIKEAVREITNKKSASNPEHHFGVLAMAGKTPQLIVTLNGQSNSTIAGMRSLQIGGQVSLSRALLVGQLALKHREDKNKRQRLVVFLGSPLVEELGDDCDALMKLGRRLKKAGIAVDFVSFGEHQENASKVEALMSGLQSGATDQQDENASHLVTVPVSEVTLTDSLKGTPVLPTPSSSASTRQGDEGMDDEMGMDMDPDLALAIRLSMEEERQRQQRSANPEATMVDPIEASMNDGGEEDEEERLLQQALAMSMQNGNDHQPMKSNELDMAGVDTNDPDIQAALRSLEDARKDDKKNEK